MKTGLKILVLLVAVALALGAVRTGWRMATVRLAFKHPEGRARMALPLEHRDFSIPCETGDMVDIGFASFRFPVNLGQVPLEEGACITLTNAVVGVLFLSPFEDEIGVELEIDAERSMPLSFREYVSLSKADFLSRLVQLYCKQATMRGWDGLYDYTARDTRGIVRIGDSREDDRNASVSISENGSNRQVGFHVKINDESDLNMEDVLRCMLSSFRFN